MAEEILKVIDGTVLLAAVPRLPIPGGAVTGADLLRLADAEASFALFGLSLPENLKSAALRRMDADAAGFPSTKYSQEEASSVLRNYITAIADELADDPLVVSVLDGTALQLILDDEDDFAVLAENLFTDLDTEDTGKLSKSKIKNALDLMGVDMGVPPRCGSSDLLTDILKKHGAEGKEELGQAQFAQLLQLVLQDLAGVLAEKHVVFIYDLKITNGSKLRKTLDNEKLLNAMIEKMMESNQSDPEGRWKIENIRGFLEKKGPELGLPSQEGNEPATLLYDQVFTDVKKGKNDVELGRENFAAVVKDILEKFSAQLEANPIFS